MTRDEIKPGMAVMATYRMPPPLQPWLHEFHIGMTAIPGSDPAEWNGHNSEAHYCEVTNKVRVEYPNGVQHEPADSLIAVVPEMIDATHEERVRYYLGAVAHDNYVRASGVKS